jgi:hypothetical protein
MKKELTKEEIEAIKKKRAKKVDNEITIKK